MRIGQKLASRLHRVPQKPPPVFPSFDGTPGEDVTAFLLALASAANDQGALFLPKWRGEKVRECLRGDALSWYLALDDETKEDWDVVRELLLSKYTPARDLSNAVETFPDSPNSSSTPSCALESSRFTKDEISFPTIPSPAIVHRWYPAPKPSEWSQHPPAMPPTCRGRIRVIVEGFDRPLYVSRNPSPSSGWHVATTEQTEALEVEFLPSMPDTLCMMNSSTPYPYLGLHWDWDDASLHLPSRHCAYFIALDDKLRDPLSSSPNFLKGPMSSSTWRLDAEGHIIPIWTNASGASVDLIIAAYNEPTGGPSCFYVVVDFNAFASARGMDKDVVKVILTLEVMPSEWR